jgi:hypothetical protein
VVNFIEDGSDLRFVSRFEQMEALSIWNEFVNMDFADIFGMMDRPHRPGPLS